MVCVSFELKFFYCFLSSFLKNKFAFGFECSAGSRVDELMRDEEGLLIEAGISFFISFLLD